MLLLKKILLKIFNWGVDYSSVQTWNYNDFTYNSGFTYYGTDGFNAPTASKCGRIVNLSGAINNTTQFTPPVIIGKVPEGCEPYGDGFQFAEQGSNVNKFNLKIYPSGELYMENYGTTSAITVPNNSWLNINATYFSAN